MVCTRCEGTGFLNFDDRLNDDFRDLDDIEKILEWISTHDDTEMTVCDCCGDGGGWYGEPGSHYSSDDPIGKNGPYAYNGGLCECH